MLLIYTPHITERIQYVMQYVFNEQFGLAFKICDDKEKLLSNEPAEKIIYSTEDIGSGIYFFSHDLLLENDIKEFDISSGKINNSTVLFKHNRQDALSFDVFAAVFYLLSRYEEYLQKPTDKFGNYDYKNSILHQLNCMHVPVVEQWINMLKKVLAEKFPLLQFRSSTAGFALSFDIDVAYAYQNRSLARTIGGLIKKIITLNFPDLIDHVLTLLYLRKDMFDTYEYIFNKIKNNKAIFFFNMGSYAQYDKNPSYKNKKFQKLIKQIAATHLIGLHPSYASNSSYNLLAKEKLRLEKISANNIISSRQHYLKLKLPFTYQQLIKNAIETDYTIGYHDGYGFRAGTCKSFLFFDLTENKTTTLRLFPFVIMDGTLNNVLKYSIEESKKIISDLIATTCEYEGVFIPLWHNSSLSNIGEWKSWRDVFEFMLDEIKNKKLVNYLENH